jgi:Cdc6-like AAA superfamily ATPase
MPDQQEEFTIQGHKFSFSKQDVHEAFSKTTTADWQNRAGYDPYWVIVVGGEEKPIKAVFRSLRTVGEDFGFSTNDAKRVFERLGFQTRDTRIKSPPKKLCLVGTWKNVLKEFDDVVRIISTKGGWASWWSFPIDDGAQNLLETPFYVYLNVGSGALSCRMKVDEYQTQSGNQGIPSPWQELTNEEWRNKTREGDSSSQIFKTWFRVTAIEKIKPPLKLEDMELAFPFSDKGNVLNQTRFGYVYETDEASKGTQPTYWWVNQGSSWKAESEGNYIFAPLTDGRGGQLGHWKSVGDVKPGDIILHYASGLFAISQVQKSAVEQVRPGVAEKGKMGRYVETEYTLLDPLVPLEKIPQQIRIKESGPFNVNGGVKQGYLFKLSPHFVAKIKHLLPSGVGPYPERIMEEDTSYTGSYQALNLPLNLILYGPPGTGKTHRLKSEYFDLFTSYQQFKTKEDIADEMAAEFRWWELVAMALYEMGEAKVSAIMTHPIIQAKIRRSQGKNTPNTIWNILQERTKPDCENVNTTSRLEPKIFWKNDGAVWSVDKEMIEEGLIHLKSSLDIYRRNFSQQVDIKRYIFTTFHQSYSYEEFVEGIKPCLVQEGSDTSMEVNYQIKYGVFKEIVSRASEDPDHPYAIFIDEISRGNVASIFGELITLIEDDKRKDADNELRATLPYSREEFVVPRNLHIIGTMNTADRSVVALDNALRRRFSFIEMMPEIDKIAQPANFGVDLKLLLQTINARIERLLDRDHVIGHSYFMPIALAENPLRALQHVFANKVLPLLQEYFYGDPAKIGMVLGESFVKVETNGTPFAKGNWEADSWEDRPIYRFANPEQLILQDFINIYEK